MALTLTNDFIFKIVFGCEENKDILLDLINAVLEDSGFPLLTSITLKNPVNTRSTDFLKDTVLDIKANDEHNRQFDIEMQVIGNEDFINRSLFYWAQLYVNQLGKGYDYDELRPVVCVNILDFVLFENKLKCHNCFMLKNIIPDDEVLTEDLSLHFIELSKKIPLGQKLADWVELFTKEGKQGESLTVLLQKNKMLQKAHDEFQRCTQDQQTRDQAIAREMFLRDQSSLLHAAERKGELKGKLEGKLEDARRFKELGVAVEIIAHATGLSIEEIANL